MKFILTDNELPSINGVEIIKLVRVFEGRRRNKTKIIMISGNVGQQFKRSVIEAGADYYLTKPVTVKQLKFYIN